MRSLEEIQKVFTKDRFATDLAKIQIVEATPEVAICEMPITDSHLNARNTVMGGAIFTLADFAASVAANAYAENTATITLHADITYLNPAKGTKLIAEGKCIKRGKSTTLYTVTVSDDLGTMVAHVDVNGYVLHDTPPVSEK